MTGAAGRIGRLLAQGWPGRLDGFDLPERDARDADALARAARGHDAIVHLAWNTWDEQWDTGTLAPENPEMALNALEAACAAGVPRVVLASSVHVRAWWPPRSAPIEPDDPPEPTGPYGASKVMVEALGRHFAAHRGLEVAAVRFGGVAERDGPIDDEMHRAVWLPHDDCRALVHAAVTAPLGAARFRVAVGVGDHPWRVHDYGPDPVWRP